MRIAFFVNSIDSETPGYTTTHLALAAHRRGHAVVYVTPGDFVLRPDDIPEEMKADRASRAARRCPRRSGC